MAQPFFGDRSEARRTRWSSTRATSTTWPRPSTSSATGCWSPPALALRWRWSGAFLVAQALARRVRRLELAARRGRARALHRPAAGRLQGRARPADAHVQPDAGAAAQVDVARKEFIATASHELRTPIFSLAGFVELLQDEDLDEDTRREFLETMAEQVARLQKLSVDLLDLSRLDAGVGRAARRAGRPVGARPQRGQRVHPGARRPRHRPRDPPAATTGPEALCDPVRVAQIVRILLDNALRHTPSGTHVTVGAARSNGTAGLIVTDTGPGLPELTASTKVFERFYTGDAARGAGLGLAIARELAERMDGRLRVRSASRGHRVHARAAHGRERRVRRTAAALLAVAGLAAAGCDSGDDDGSERPAGGHHHARAGRRGAGRSEGGFDPAQIYDRLAPGRGDDPVDLRGRRQRPRRTAARAARAPASCSTARATSPPTRTWSRATAASRAEEVFVEFSDGNRVPGEDRRRRPERRRRPAEGRPGGPVADAAAPRRLAHASTSASRWRPSAARSASVSRSRSA